jgi:hypothetical protein
MAAGLGAASPDVVAPADDGEVDGCASGADIGAADITPDEQLPAASGGVAALPQPDADEDHADGCAPAVDAAGVTTDHELPAAAGGGA